MISRMARVRLYGPHPLLSRTTALLHDLGSMHVDGPSPEIRWGFRPLEEAEEKTGKLLELETFSKRLKNVLLLLPPPGKNPPPDTGEKDPDLTTAESTQFLAGLLSEAEHLHRRRKSAQEQHALLRKYEKFVLTLTPLLEGIASSPYLEMVGLTLDRGHGEMLPLIRQALDQLTAGDYQVYSAELDRETVAAVLVFGRSHSLPIKKLLLERDLPEIRLPGRMADLSLKEALLDIRRQIKSLPEEIRESNRLLAQFSGRWYSFLALCRDRLLDRIEQTVITRRFLSSKYCFLVEGWVPTRDAPRLRKSIEEAFEGRVVVELLEVGKLAEAPVQIRNPALVKPFEVFTRLLPLPSYGTLDPAPYFAFFFPLFFGLILGDIGYGLVILAISLLVRPKTAPGSSWRSLTTVLSISSLFAVCFGVLFGEFFSTLGERFHLLRYVGKAVTDEAGRLTYHPLLYDRVEALTTFLVLALVIGVVHVFLGLILGIATALSTGRYQRGAFKSGMLIALLSIVVLCLALALEMPAAVTWSAVSVFTLSLVGITLLEGFVAPIELVSTLGNILSYTRIMAIGLASVILGLVANRLGALPDNLAAGVCIAAALHAVNIAMGIFSPTIHSMRLHFVEFFGKFYEPGGRPYQPFKKCKGV